MKLGSLFDGSGGFPLAGIIHGIEPVWASEIEPFPIRVTKARLPGMKHLGSVTDINGAEIEPVDIITFGSPCQDLSVAGKQAGIHEGQRSSLFFEAIRIIKEMREHDRAIGRADHDVRPRFAVWENVPGAFSSNKGHDFQAVLQALCEIEGKDVSVPMPPKGKWNPAGCVVGNGWSLAWRVYDAQFWGVPQRRKRIYLVADFGSERAGEILFEPESVRGNPAESGESWEGTAEDAEGSAGRSDRVRCLTPWDCESKRQYEIGGVYRTLDAGQCQGGQAHGVCYPAAFMGGQGAKARSIAYCDDGSTPTIKSAPSGGNTVPDVVYATGADLYNGQITGDKVATLGANSGQSANHAGPSVVYPINTMVATRGGKDDGRTTFGVVEPGDPQFTISAAHEHAVCYAIKGNFIDRDTRQNGIGWRDGEMYTLDATDSHSVCYPHTARALTARHDSSPCVDRGQNVVCYAPTANHCGSFAEANVSATLQTGYHYGSGGDASMVVYPIDQHQQDARFKLIDQDGPVPTLSAKMGTGGNNTPMILAFEPGQAKRDGNECRFTENKVGTLRANMGDNQPAVCIERKVDE